MSHPCHPTPTQQQDDDDDAVEWYHELYTPMQQQDDDDVAEWNDEVYHDMPFTRYVRDGKYDKVLELLAEGRDPNMPFRTLTEIKVVTGMEWSLYNLDWKMLAIFFRHGADVINNRFTGEIQTQKAYEGLEDEIVLDYWEQRGTVPIPGFHGLDCMMKFRVYKEIETIYDDSSLHQTKACLWLMKRYQSKTVDTTEETIYMVRECVRFLNRGNIWNDEFFAPVHDALLCLKRMAVEGKYLPKELVTKIIEFNTGDMLINVVTKSLDNVLEKFGTSSRFEAEDLPKKVYSLF